MMAFRFFYSTGKILYKHDLKKNEISRSFPNIPSYNNLNILRALDHVFDETLKLGAHFEMGLWLQWNFSALRWDQENSARKLTVSALRRVSKITLKKKGKCYDSKNWTPTCIFLKREKRCIQTNLIISSKGSFLRINT